MDGHGRNLCSSYSLSLSFLAINPPYYQPTDRSENGKRTRESGWIARASTVKIPFEMDWMVLVFKMLDKLLQAHKPCSSTKFVKWSQDQNRDRPFLGEVFGVIGEGKIHSNR